MVQGKETDIGNIIEKHDYLACGNVSEYGSLHFM